MAGGVRQFEAGQFAALERVFGPNALVPPLFYRHSPALRFELSGGETQIAQFLQAIDRARAILGSAFAGAETLTAVLEVWDDTSDAAPQPEQLWQKTEAALRNIGVCPPAPEQAMRQWGGEGGPKTLFAFPLPSIHLPELLWGIFARDLGLQPALDARLTLASAELGLLACPYDDRGMDVIGIDAARLAGLYTSFDGWLLDHDRARMAGMFSSPGPADEADSVHPHPAARP